MKQWKKTSEAKITIIIEDNEMDGFYPSNDEQRELRA